MCVDTTFASLHPFIVSHKLTPAARQVQVVRTASEFRSACQSIRSRGHRLGFVPTLGALHAAHAALIHRAQQLSDSVAVSIFVNPTQFGPGEDLARYPRDLDADVRMCRDVGVSIVFAPEPAEIYPDGEQTRVRVGGLSGQLCGRSRPTHFEGVATVVAKLFIVAGPCVAVFGRKDYQQLRVIERLVEDLLLDVKVVAHPTVREPDGLAMSSRNRYLDANDRQRAGALSRGLSLSVRAFERGERETRKLMDLVRTELKNAGVREDYVQIVDSRTLEGIDGELRDGCKPLLAVAAFVGSARLIDNVVLGEDLAPSGLESR